MRKVIQILNTFLILAFALLINNAKAQNCPTITTIWTDISCNGANNGTAEAIVTGGSGNFIYDWSTGATTAAVVGLMPGIHYVNVTDTTEDCNVFGVVEIYEPELLVAVPTSTPVSCFGGINGTATANVSGGTEPYTILWSNGDVGPIATGLAEATYTVTITDANNCATFGTVDVGISNTFAILFDSIQHVSCTGYSDGSVVANATGGSGVYSYLWNTGDTTAAIDTLSAGYYDVTVSDMNGCVLTDSTLIVEPLPLSATILSEFSTSCYYSCDGASTVQANGGTTPYNYLWDANTGSQIGTTATLLCPDTFVVSVIDDNGCQVLTSAIITAPDTIVLVDSVINASCFQNMDGFIYTQVFNTSGPLQYQWSDSNFVLSQTGPDLLNVPAGVYYVNIFDSLGCNYLDTFLITQPEVVRTDMLSFDVSCAGGSDGSITQTVSGGTAPYDFLWTDGDTFQDRMNIPAGTYTVTITDINGCLATDSIEVFEPEPLIVEAQIYDVSCIQESNGSISVFVGGGNGGYQYLWSTGDTDDEIFGQIGGIYSVTVTDALGCVISENYEILVTNEDCINIPSAFTPNSDGLNDTWILRNIDLYAGNSVKILNRWGQLLFESNGYGEPWDGRYNGNELPSGTYYYIVDLNDGNDLLTGPITLVK